MLSSVGIVSSSRSRVIVPDISGLSSSDAVSALTAASLTAGTVTTTTSGATSGNNGQVASQGVSAGSDLERGATVSYVTYSYTCVPSYSYNTTYGSCNGCTQPYSTTRTDDTCGTGTIAWSSGTINCESNVQIDSVDEFTGATSTTCNYKNTKTYQNSCTGALTYTYSTFTRARACPTCGCPI